jgi:hypothetical protein
VKGADGLSAHAATGAVIIITELLSVVASPIDPGLWLDILLLRWVLFTTCARSLSTHSPIPPGYYCLLVALPIDHLLLCWVIFTTYARFLCTLSPFSKGCCRHQAAIMTPPGRILLLSLCRLFHRPPAPLIGSHQKVMFCPSQLSKTC